MKRLLLLSAVLLALTARADETRRPMLEQGKTWYYTYHHFEDRETPEETTYPVKYTLRGDTVIDGRQYMKMYRYELKGSNRYYGAFREDEEGRVWQYDYESDKQDFMLFDISLHFGEKHFANTTPIVETVKVSGQLIHRYRYQNIRPDGSLYMLGYVAVEGVGFEDKGLIHYLFEPEFDCICDYETFDYVMAPGFIFSNADFQSPKYIELTQDELQLVQQNNDFAFRLMSKMNRGGDLILSPLSITYALGMLNNGAAGQTQQEINQVLGFGQAGADAINQFCRKLLTESGTLDESVKVSIANTIFVNNHWGWQLKPDFVQKANDYYDAQPESRDFYDSQTVDVINQWASDHTEQMIKKVLDEVYPDYVSYLLNAIYFKGAWQNKFDETYTTPETFDHAGYTKELTTFPTMHKMTELAYAEDDDYQAVSLPYGNGAYTMTVLLPKPTGTKLVNTVPQVPTTTQYEQLCRTMEPTEVDLKLPRFETDTDERLEKVMSELGMPTAFTGQAEFPDFCDVPTCIGLMKQVAKIKVNEEGTEAAAVTVVGELTSMVPRNAKFYATRPFLYIISEQSTGVIFFIGQFSGVKNSVDGYDGIDRLTIGHTTTDQPLYNLNGQRLQSPPARGLYISGGRKMVVR